MGSEVKFVQITASTKTVWRDGWGGREKVDNPILYGLDTYGQVWEKNIDEDWELVGNPQT